MNGLRPPTTDTDIGQPDTTYCCSRCCSEIVGTFYAGGTGDVPVAALVKLKDDQQWLAEIMQIGLVDGTGFVDFDEVTNGTCQVRKRGAGSRLTGGVVTKFGTYKERWPNGIPPGAVAPHAVPPEAILIRPNPNPAKPGQDICFSNYVDRGAVVVYGKRIIGLLYDELPVQEGSSTVVYGVAARIGMVIDALKTLAGISLKVAETLEADVVHTTTNRNATRHAMATPPVVAVRPPLEEPLSDFPIDVGATAGNFAWLQDELSRTHAGRLAIALWTDHRGEIRYLIDHNRKVATVWHRSGGPAVLQAIVRAFQVPAAIVPDTVNGLPIAVALDRVARVLCKYGSPTLRSDMEQFHSLLPPIGGLSFHDILASVYKI